MRRSRHPMVALMVLCGLIFVSRTLAHQVMVNAALRSAAQQCASHLQQQQQQVQSQAQLRLANSAATLFRRRSATSIFSAVSKVESSTCTADAEVTEGPYYIKNEFKRNDIRDGEPGVPLILDFTLIDVSNCSYVPYASVELWHCNASGTYAGYTGMDPDTGAMRDGAVCIGSTPSTPTSTTSTPVTQQMPPPMSGGPGGGGAMPPGGPGGGMGGPGGGGGGGSSTCMTDYKTFLRGYQVTNNLGNVQMTTIYPGFYVGRTPHIHVMIRTSDESVRHIGQLFFDDTMTASVFTVGDYAAHITKVGDTWIRTSSDGIYQGTGGQGTLNLVQLDDSDISQGLIGAVNIYIDSTAIRSVSSTVSVSPEVAQPPATPYAVTPVPPAVSALSTSTPAVASSGSSSSSTPTSAPTSSSSSTTRVVIASIVVIAIVAVCGALLMEWKAKKLEHEKRAMGPSSDSPTLPADLTSLSPQARTSDLDDLKLEESP